jgi:DNA modification methylase
MKLYNGDCLEIMKLIPDKSIDAIITDPPYGTTACKWDSVIPFDLMWKQLSRIIKDNGAIVLFGSEPFSSHLRMSNIKNYKYDWIWCKSIGANPLLCKKRPMKYHENILVFYKKQPTYNPQMTKGKMRNKKPIMSGLKTDENWGGAMKNIKGLENINDLYYPRSYQYFSNANQKAKQHPTQKPVALMEYLIKTYTNEFETVLDFTMGSGTTGVACCNTNRDFIGIELDKEYFKIAQERIKNEL